MDFDSHLLLAEFGPVCRGPGSDGSSRYRKGKGFAHFFGSFWSPAAIPGSIPAPFHLWKAQTREDLTFRRGQPRERPRVSSEPPGRAEAAEGRRGDSKERKGEKEGKDRERKVNLGRKVLHTFGLPGWRGGRWPHGGRAPQPLRGLVTQRGSPGGIPVRRCRGAASPFPGDLVPSPASAQKDDGEKKIIKGLR